MKEIMFVVHPFRMGDEKESALKPLEEAAEVFGQAQLLWDERPHCKETECEDCDINWNRFRHDGLHPSYFCTDSGDFRGDLADEIADCIQACCNLASRYDIDIDKAMERCERRNRERGRYNDGESDSSDRACDCHGDCCHHECSEAEAVDDPYSVISSLRSAAERYVEQIASLSERLSDAMIELDEAHEQCVDYVVTIGRMENELDRVRGVEKDTSHLMPEVEFVSQSSELVRCTEDPEDAIASAARVCTKSKPKGKSPLEWLQAQVRLVVSLVKNQHLSPIEFADADFLLEVDRAIQQELTRHRHFSYQIESTRWVDYRKKPLRFVTKPPAGMRVPNWYVKLTEEFCELSALVYTVGLDAGVPRDYARKNLLLALASNMRMKGNFRMWYEMLPKRLGKTAHPEVREVAGMVKESLSEICPAVFDRIDGDA